MDRCTLISDSEKYRNHQLHKLPISFYRQPDVVQLGRTLLGKYLFTNFEGCLTGGIIVETESYAGIKDRACHAFGGRYTQRTATMYAAGGICYVYLCYGIHHLFNIVVNTEASPEAVLVRAIEPVIGIDIMMLRRNIPKPDKRLTSGPGAMSQALGIKTKHNGLDLIGNNIWIEDRDTVVADNQIVAGPRIGVAYAKEDALLPYRFYIKDNPWVSGKL